MRFRSLPNQVAVHLKSEIAKGRWREFLPGERVLAENLHVSRRTVASAIEQLRQAEVIRSEPGRGHRILSNVKNADAKRIRQVGMLTAEPLYLMRPGLTLWAYELQSMLAQAGYHLNFFHGHKFVSRHPDQALRRLVTVNPQACWIIVNTSRPAQRWFAREGVPVILSGSCHSGLNLPDVDIDFAAVGRHVAGGLLARGHRKAVLLLSQAPGYLASEDACKEGFTQVFHDGGGEAIVVYHESTRDGITRVISRLFKGSNPPTGLVVKNSLDYLSATSFLAQLGLRVPHDVSVISRVDDAVLGALLPEPTRYRASQHLIVRKVFKLLTQVIEGETITEPNVRIIPEFIAGESLVAARDSAEKQ